MGATGDVDISLMATRMGTKLGDGRLCHLMELAVIWRDFSCPLAGGIMLPTRVAARTWRDWRCRYLANDLLDEHQTRGRATLLSDVILCNVAQIFASSGGRYNFCNPWSPAYDNGRNASDNALRRRHWTRWYLFWPSAMLGIRF